MSLSGISFGGLATGLDTKAIIGALMAVERRPIFALERKKTLLNRSKTLFNTFQTRLEELQKKAKAIKDIDSFLKFSAATDNEEKFFGINASEKASAGSYTVVVNELAIATTRSSAGSADKDTTTVTDATPFTFNFGDGTSFTVSPSSSLTLDGLADQINNATDGSSTQNKVRATVLDTGGTGANRYKLVLTALKEGTDAGFTVAGDTGGSQTETFFNGLNEDSAASNSEISINGVIVTRSSNTISDAIEGVTLNLKSKELNNSTVVTISTDTEATAAKVKEFVDAYNSVVEFIKTQNELGEDGEAKGPLFGDVTLRQIRSSLRGIVGDSFATGNTAYSLFSQVGIEAETDGTLTFTQGKFDEALADDPSAVKKLFSDQTVGAAGILFAKIDSLTDSIDGVFKARLDGFDRQIRYTDDSIANKERRLEDFEARQVAKFAALEGLIAQLQAQGSAFSAFSPISPR